MTLGKSLDSIAYPYYSSALEPIHSIDSKMEGEGPKSINEIKAMRACSDRPGTWTKFENLKQEDKENSSQFMDRLIKLGSIYVYLDLSRERDVRQIRIQFVKNSFKVVKNSFMTSCPNWLNMDLEKLKEVSECMFLRDIWKQRKRALN